LTNRLSINLIIRWAISSLSTCIWTNSSYCVYIRNCDTLEHTSGMASFHVKDELFESTFWLECLESTVKLIGLHRSIWEFNHTLSSVINEIDVNCIFTCGFQNSSVSSRGLSSGDNSQIILRSDCASLIIDNTTFINIDTSSSRCCWESVEFIIVLWSNVIWGHVNNVFCFDSFLQQ